jgi:hypothetical protein
VGHVALEVADIFRTHGPAWRKAQRGHLSLGQLKVMSAIERAAARHWGHVCAVRDAAPTIATTVPQPALPEVPAGAARRWLQARQADLLPVESTPRSSRCRRQSPTSRTRTRL